MVELKRFEELRTRREIEDYFKQLGEEITEEELDALKQSYDKAQENSGALTLQQLDDVAGGVGVHFVMRAEGPKILFHKVIYILSGKNLELAKYIIQVLFLFKIIIQTILRKLGYRLRCRILGGL